MGRKMYTVRDLTHEEQSEFTRLSSFQALYVIYGTLYGGFWLKVSTVFGITEVDDLYVVFFVVSSAVLFILTSVTLLHNHKYETYSANKRCCNIVSLFAVGCFVYRFINLMIEL
jgi:hypothetical protein